MLARILEASGGCYAGVTISLCGNYHQNIPSLDSNAERSFIIAYPIIFELEAVFLIGKIEQLDQLGKYPPHRIISLNFKHGAIMTIRQQNRQN
ncbi:MAG: hypothetical protein B6I35_09235 [Anaerolineaceae bacterium 4572_32.2]|nr:MAG: hypothetical protein B6I35_09235 [Anaerolineaceae bacterium 4572_32.2]